MPESARIVVRRPRGGARDLLRRYRIELDGTKVATVARGGTAEVAVAPGTHRVRARIDWLGSPTLRVELAPGEVTRLRVEPAGSVVRMDQLFRGAGYLRLSPEEGAAAPEERPASRPSWGVLALLPVAFFAIFLVSYGVHGLIRHDRGHSWTALVGGVALYVVALALGRWARRRRRAAEREDGGG